MTRRVDGLLKFVRITSYPETTKFNFDCRFSVSHKSRLLFRQTSSDLGYIYIFYIYNSGNKNILISESLNKERRRKYLISYLRPIYIDWSGLWGLDKQIDTYI